MLRNLTSASFFILFSCSTLISSGFISSASAQEPYDPWEGFNRGIFWFNDGLDIHVLEPVAQGYEDIVPDSVEEGVSNFFLNLNYPQYLVSDLVQLKFSQALDHTGRFLINTTVGVAGIFDVAKHVGLEDHKEDFGIALAYYDVPPGPYIVLPIIGPSNVRDGVGLIVDFFLNPLTILGFTSVDDDIVVPVQYGGYALKLVNTRADLLEAIKSAKSSSIDYYLFVQSAYYQHRRGVLYDGDVPDEFMDNDEVEEAPTEPEASTTIDK